MKHPDILPKSALTRKGLKPLCLAILLMNVEEVTIIIVVQGSHIWTKKVVIESILAIAQIC